MFRRRLTLLLVVSSIGFVVSFVYALWVFGSAAGLRMSPENQARMRVTSGAELIRIFTFDDAQQGPSVLSMVPSELVGLSSTELAEAFPNWRLVSFAPDRVVVEESCSELQGGFLKAEGDRLVVYDGTIDGCHRPTGNVEIDLANLSPLQRAELTHGVSFASESDLALILEGMLAP